MKKLVSILLLSLFTVSGLLASEGSKVVISGKVSDKETHETLAGVKVFIVGTSLYTYTDLNGNYTLFVPNNAQLTIVFSSVSYAENKLDLKTAQNQTQIELIPQ